MVKRSVWVMAAAVLALGVSACGGDDDDVSSAAGTGGVTAGAGGVAGSTIAGASGAAGTSMAGAGTAGMGAEDLNSCASADTSMDGPALHAAAATALGGPMSNCSSSPSCHQGERGKAGLTLLGQTDLRTLLVGKMSCETTAMPVVSDGGGDTALQNSWLWLKLTHPLDANMDLVGDAAWGTPGSCNQTNVGSFGFRMPWGLTGSTWPNASKVRDWICKGAPGP